MCNHYKKLLILIAAATLFLSGCGSSNNNSPAAPGLTNPAGITVAPIDDNNPATVPAVFAMPAAINDSNQIVGSAEAAAGGLLKPTFWIVDNQGAATVAPTEMNTVVVDGFASAHDINSDGVIVGNAANIDTSLRAVVWGDKDAAPALLNSLAGGFFAAAYGINDTGQIVGTSENIDGLLKAVRWQRAVDGTLTGPSILPGVPVGWEAEANAVNADNHIVGELVDAAGISSAVVWEWDGVSSSYTALNLPVPAGFDHAVAFDLNSPAPGQPLLVVGEVSDDGLSGLTHAVRWSIDASNNITVIDLGTTDRSSSAAAVNSAGRAAGWENNASAVSLATSWNNPTGKAALFANDSQAFDINNNNVVVGRSAGQGFVKLAN